MKRALIIGNLTSIVLVALSCFRLCMWLLPDTLQTQFFRENLDANGNEIPIKISNMNVFYSCLVGPVFGAVISSVTEYYKGLGKKPILKIVQQSSTGVGTNIIAGLATEMTCSFPSVLLFAVRSGHPMLLRDSMEWHLLPVRW